jgi:hypothetical protein
MTTIDECVHCDHLLTTIEAAHERALVALTSADARRFDAVAWLSAHLAAVALVLDPLVDRYVPRSVAERQEEQRVTHELQLLLRTLEQVAAADVHAPRVDIALLRGRLLSLLASHAAAEHLLVDRLARALPPDDAVALAFRYERAVAHGPTRPHPYAWHTGPLGRLVFTLDRARDRVLDVLDSRPVPIPAPRRPPRRPGKWGDYLLGQMHDEG